MQKKKYLAKLQKQKQKALSSIFEVSACTCRSIKSKQFLQKSPIYHCYWRTKSCEKCPRRYPCLILICKMIQVCDFLYILVQLPDIRKTIKYLAHGILISKHKTRLAQMTVLSMVTKCIKVSKLCNLFALYLQRILFLLIQYIGKLFFNSLKRDFH